MTATSGTMASHAARAGATLLDRVRSAVAPSAGRPAGGGLPASGWSAVTVLKEVSEIDTAALPAPLAELGERIEVRVRAAADGKGSELAARLRARRPSGTALGRLTGSDGEGDVRSALRRAKQLLEVGEVLAVDPAPHGERTATPGGVLLEAWTRVAPRGGVR